MALRLLHTSREPVADAVDWLSFWKHLARLATLDIRGRYMGGCQNYGPFVSTLNIRCCIIIGIQKGPSF